MSFLNLRSSMLFKASVAASIFVTISAHAAMEGGNSGGGGHPVETGAKTKILGIFETLGKMAPEARAKLRFNPHQIRAKLMVDRNFQPLCATGVVLERMREFARSTLSRIREEEKMMRVFDETPNILYVNCTDYNLDQWNALYKSEELKDLMFFTHEGLRIAGAKAKHEDAYDLSGSILEAYEMELTLARKIAQSLMAPRPSRCGIFAHVSPKSAVASKNYYCDGYLNLSADLVSAATLIERSGDCTNKVWESFMKEELFNSPAALLKTLYLARTFNCISDLSK